MTDFIELSVRFVNSAPTGADPQVNVSLFRLGTGASTLPQPWTPPLTDGDLADLRWYLETFSLWPTGPDYVRAEGIKSKLEGWGRDLRDSFLVGQESARLWQQFLDAPTPPENGDGGKLLTLDATEVSVLRLPWELLADEGGHLFAKGIGVRRRLQESTRAPGQSGPAPLPVRLLVVMARPDGAGFIDPRAVSKPLLDALDSLGEQVAVEFLYPPTVSALTQRLRDRAAPRVHVVHFDGHGVYDARQGLGYLLFEDDSHGRDLVDAERLGTLLVDTHVPLMVLNACQSAAQQEADPYASVAARLIRAGVGSVLAMNYSVLVAAARRFVGRFYAALAQGQTVGRAVDAGRFALLEDEQRHTLTRRNDDGELVDETIQLRDWFLPALYQQAADPVIFAPARPGSGAAPTRRPLPTALTAANSPGGLPARPAHGFHGRAREILKLEREFARRAVVVVHGFGGQGKTALAGEAGRWFHRTGRFPGGAAFVSFEHGGSLEQLCSWVGQAVSEDPDFMIRDGDAVQRVADLLAARPALVILDNFESVLGREPLMPGPEVQAVLDAVWRWADGERFAQERGQPGPAPRHSVILITTRDTSFPDARFAPGGACAHLPLEGLADRDALDLAAAILDDRSIDRASVPRQDLVDLMARLGGHPLSLNLVLPQLAHYTPAQLSARFEELLPGFVQGKAAQRNESLALSLEFSLRRLGEESRAALPDLAVFQGVAFEDDMLAITEIDEELWRTARVEMEQAALVTVEQVPGVTPPFLRFHPTLLPALAPRLDPARRAALAERYWQRYYALVDYLYQADATTPHQARAIAQRELPNLAHAFNLAHAALDRATDPPAQADLLLTVVDFADRLSRFLNAFGRWRERDALQGRVHALQDRLAGDGPLTKAGFTLLYKEGESLMQQGRAGDAERVFRTLLARLEAGAAYDSTYDQGLTLAWLGRCLASQGRPAAAVPVHRQALTRFQSIAEEDEQAKRQVGFVHADLADNLRVLGQYEDARRNYEESLHIANETENLRSVGVALGQLGQLALAQNDLAEARRRYVEALSTFRALGEPQTEAVIWHQLGRVAEEARAWDEAERCYRESLGIAERTKDLPGVARTCNQLALVAQGAGRLDDAERWYLRAIEGFEQTGQHQYLAVAANNLADLYLTQGRLDAAESYARRAAAIMEGLDASAEPWKTYQILAEIAAARGDSAQAASWRRKEQESYAGYAGAAYQMPEWAPSFIEGVAAACGGDGSALKQVENALSQMAETKDWNNLPPVVRQILAGERDAGRLSADLDRIDAYIVRSILDRLAGKAPAATPPPAPRNSPPAPSQDGLTLDQLVQLVAAARQPGAPPQLAGQLAPLLAALSQDPQMPGEIQALGQALAALRAGQTPDLSGLPAQVAELVRGVL